MQHLQQMERILHISRELTSTLSLDQLLRKITLAVVELTDCELTAVLLLEQSSGELHFVAANTLVDEFVKIPVPLDASIAGVALSTGQPVIAPDVRDDPRHYKVIDQMVGIETRSLLAVPMYFQDRPIGVLEAENKRHGAEFGQEDTKVLTALAAQSAVAIENARLVEALQSAQAKLENQVKEQTDLTYERTAELIMAVEQLEEEISVRIKAEKKLQQRNRALTLLNRVGQQLTATLDLQQLSWQLQEIGLKVIGAESASVWLQTSEQGEGLVCWATSQHDQEHSLLNLCLPPGQGIAGWVVQTGESVLIPYAPDDPRFFSDIDKQTDFDTISLLAVPLQVRGKVIGVLEIVNKPPGGAPHGENSEQFDEDDLALTETLAASAAIAIDNAKLVEKLRQRTTELQAHNQELDAFAHTVAHDLKTPLAALIGFIEVLEQDYESLPREELEYYLSIVGRSGRKMSNIVDELLLLASVRKVDQVELAPLDMAAVIAEAQERLDSVITEQQAQIVLAAAEDWPQALGHAPWVEEVWANYMSNALKYGGKPPRIELGAAKQADGYVYFWVRDNGQGLTPEEQARLFAPFTRLHQVRAKGHGLGLSIVQRIVAKFGGKVGVKSQNIPGQGCTFFFTLPGVQ